MEEIKKAVKSHSLSLKDRKNMNITGVSEIISFDETCVSLEINEYQLNIYGTCLKISAFSNDSGEVSIDGVVDSVVYAGKTQSSYRRGILKRIFSDDE